MTRANCYTVYNTKTDELIILDGTSKECAEAMGISVESFYSYLSLSRKGVVSYFITETKCEERAERMKQIAKLRSEGEKLYYIANLFGVSVQTVRENLKKFGFPQSNYGAKTKAIVEAYKKNPNRTQGSIARELGFSQPLVSATIKKYCR